MDEYEHAIDRRDTLVIISLDRDLTPAEILQYKYWDKVCENLENKVG